MKKFEFTIKDKLGIHARPAGFIVKEAMKFESEIDIEKDGEKANAKKLFALMGLNVKFDDTVSIYISGHDEDDAFIAIKAFFNEHL
jgi:Phosphotransferase System HPr (HPr) Family